MLNIVFGGAGFIGSNLVKRLIAEKEQVLVVDDYSLGSRENITALEDDKIINGDINETETINNLIDKIGKFVNRNQITIWHMAANSDILQGANDIEIDWLKTLATTKNILKFMKKVGISKLNFASSSAVYGDRGIKPISENEYDLQPVSFYGACKLASEALISSARESFLEDVSIFRFPNVVGCPATHGVIFDFVRKLSVNPKTLFVLGDGTQKKSYLYVDDLVDAMIFISSKGSAERLKIFNIGNSDQGITVKEIAELVVKTMKLNAKIVYGQDQRGWVGDIPKFHYNVEKLKKFGWQTKKSSLESIKTTIEKIMKNAKN